MTNAKHTGPTTQAKAPRTKPAEIRLEELMAAAEKLFLAKGVEASTINDIVEEAKVAKGTFYHYFSSKNDILLALRERYTHHFLLRLEQAVQACAPDDWHGRLRAWIHTNIKAYLDTYELHDIAYTQHHHHDRSNQDKNAILEQLIGLLEQGRQAQAWNPPDTRVVALLIYSGVHGATDELIVHKGKDYEAFAQAVTHACMRMLDSPAS